MSLVIALDGMGGDHAPEIVIEGAAALGKSCPSCAFCCSATRRVSVP